MYPLLSVQEFATYFLTIIAHFEITRAIKDIVATNHHSAIVRIIKFKSPTISFDCYVGVERNRSFTLFA